MKRITLPFSPQDMVEFFKDKSSFYEVDFDETLKVMNEKSMLMYLSNLNIACTFTSINKTLVYEYITAKELPNIEILKHIHCNLLHLVKYGNMLYDVCFGVFNAQDHLDFVIDNEETLVEQTMVMDSITLYIITRGIEIADDDDRPLSAIQDLTTNIDNTIHECIGHTLFLLIAFDDFPIMFSCTVPALSDQVYYSRYFDEYMFSGSNLFSIASSSQMLTLILMITSSNPDTITDLNAVELGMMEIVKRDEPSE